MVINTVTQQAPYIQLVLQSNKYPVIGVPIHCIDIICPQVTALGINRGCSLLLYTLNVPMMHKNIDAMEEHAPNQSNLCTWLSHREWINFKRDDFKHPVLEIKPEELPVSIPQQET